MRPDQVAEGFIQSGLENVKGCEDCLASLWATRSGFDCPHNKKPFPASSQNLSCFNYHNKHVSVVGNTFCHVGPDISGALSASDF